MSFVERLDSWSPRILSLLRIGAGLLFLEHGLIKLIGFPVAGGMPHPLPAMLLAAGLLEAVGGVLLTLGLFTRPVAFIVSGEMAIAYFTWHMRQSIWPAANQGDAAVLFCWLFFFFIFRGAGPWSLDARLFRR